MTFQNSSPLGISMSFSMSFSMSLALFASPALAQQAVARSERVLLSPVSPAADQRFGSAVAVDSSTAAFGAPAALSSAGAVTIFERGSSNTWLVGATIAASDSAAADAFGTSTGVDGSLVVVGAPMAGGTASADQGAAYIFRKIGSSWTQVAKLVAADGAFGDAFGTSVAIKGDTVVVGAPGADGAGAIDRGAAYIFRNTSANIWTEQSKLSAAGGAAGDRFGAAVATRSSRALIGAPARSSGAGAAYIFRNTSGSWSQAVSLASGEAGAIGFGTSVALSNTLVGDWAFVGAPESAQSGAAFVYLRATDTSWPFEARLVASDIAAGDAFGAALSAADDRVIVGSPLSSVRGIEDAGSARVFRRMASGSWQEGSKLAAATGSSLGGFASAVALAGERVMVGAPTTANGATNRGAGYHYKLDYARTSIDDNGRSDVLWFSPASGNIAAWSMNGLVRDSGGILSNSVDASYEYEGAGDLFGDGRTSVLLRHKTTGAFRMWRLSGLNVIDDRFISGGIAAEWQYLALGDISGDGKADVLLRNALTGQVNGWIMSGANKAVGGAIGNSLGLTYAGIGDFDGDGRSDLLWLNAAGQARAWMMNGLSIVSDIAIANAASVATTWRVAVTADLDGDSDDDVVWRNTVTGAVSGWIMAGASLQSVGTLHAGIALNWRIEFAGDLNADGTDDIVWRNMTNGDVNAWLMNGLVKTSGAFVKNVALNWSMLNDDDYNDDHGRDGNGNDDNRDDSNDNDYDDNGGANNGGGGGGNNGGGGNGGNGGGGNETTTGSAFNSAIDAARAVSNLPILQVEVEFEANTTYVAVLQWRASDSKLVYVVVHAGTLAIVSNTSWTPTAAQLADYGVAISVSGLATISPTTAVSQVLAANPGSQPHSVELEEESGAPKWEVTIVSTTGVVSKFKVAAR